MPDIDFIIIDFVSELFQGIFQLYWDEIVEKD